MCLTVAIIRCGNVIEGVTDEVTFRHKTTTEGGLQILTLQKARTVGDQHFPSCVIWMAGNHGLIKVSRLNKKDYRSQVTISTFLAVTGYVVQFVGLRALHWSATITQLGITLIMTAIRAWVRRGLASDPDWYPLMEGHEVSSLALLFYYSPGDVSNVSRPQKRTEMAKQPLYELMASYDTHVRVFFKELFDSSTGRGQTLLDFGPSGDCEENSALLKIYGRISKEAPLGSIDKEAAVLSTMFSAVVGSVMDALSVSGMLLWEREASGQPSEQLATDSISWRFDINTPRPTADGSQSPATKNISFRLQRSTDHAQHRWTLLDHDQIAALLSLSAQALATRLEHLHHVRGTEKLSIGDELFFVGRGVSYHPSSSGRIVGSTNNDDTSSNKEMIEEWLDADVRLQKFRWVRSYSLNCYLGVFLSSASSPRGWNLGGERNLVIKTRRDSGLLLQWTQELFSIFMLAIASKVRRVLGETEEVDGKRGEGKRSFKNSVFDTIADVAVKKGLTHDRDEAYTLIVPAFAKCGLLPTCNNEQTAESTSEMPAPPTPSSNDENTP